MQPFTTILAPVDFSDTSDSAFRMALFLARQGGARLVVLHVIDETMDFSGFYVPHPSLDRMDQEFVKGATRMMTDFCRRELGGYVNVATSIVHGVPYKEILRAAEESAASLIVLGTHGRSGIERVAFGSTAERVVRRALCPVLTVPLSAG
jgi:universal stress protein A